MSRVPYSVGDRVLVSRHETGEGHEPATVMDSYELIIGDDRRPMVTVEFEDGERIYLKAAPPHVLPAEPEEDEADEDADDEADDEASGTAEEAADRGGDDAHPGPADSSDGG